MALIQCSECGKEVSDKAEQCVACGNPITKQPALEKVETASDKIVALEDMKRYKTNHILHLLLSVVTLGIWVIVWLFITSDNTTRRNIIRKEHNLEQESNAARVFALIFLSFSIYVLYEQFANA